MNENQSALEGFLEQGKLEKKKPQRKELHFLLDRKFPRVCTETTDHNQLVFRYYVKKLNLGHNLVPG